MIYRFHQSDILMISQIDPTMLLAADFETLYFPDETIENSQSVVAGCRRMTEHNNTPYTGGSKHNKGDEKTKKKTSHRIETYVASRDREALSLKNRQPSMTDEKGRHMPSVLIECGNEKTRSVHR